VFHVDGPLFGAGDGVARGTVPDDGRDDAVETFFHLVERFQNRDGVDAEGEVLPVILDGPCGEKERPFLAFCLFALAGHHLLELHRHTSFRVILSVRYLSLAQ